MIDSFIEGDIKLADILVKMNEEKKSSRNGAHAAAIRDNRRISEMLNNRQGATIKQTKNTRNQKPTPENNHSAFFTLGDFLKDLDDD